MLEGGSTGFAPINATCTGTKVGFLRHEFGDLTFNNGISVCPPYDLHEVSNRCEILGLRRGVVEIFDLLGRCAASMDSYRRFGKAVKFTLEQAMSRPRGEVEV